jgi:hypothetical protein
MEGNGQHGGDILCEQPLGGLPKKRRRSSFEPQRRIGDIVVQRACNRL